MLFKCITLSWNAALEGFDDAPLRDFIKDKVVSQLRDYFYIHDQIPRLTVVVYYQLSNLAGNGKDKTVKMGNDEAKNLLEAGDMPLYHHLRDWRNELAKQTGVPPYVIANNQQLALMVQHKPQSLAQLAKIEGLGTAKIQQYGQLILDQLSKPINIAKPIQPQEDEHGPTTA